MATTDATLQSVFGRPEEGAFAGVVGNERQARLRYWKKPDGWIDRGPDVSTDAPKYQQFIQKGWRQLPASFGQEVVGKGRMFPQSSFPRGQEHFWLQPFFEAGGHTYVCSAVDAFGREGEFLMPASQLISLGLHRNKDIVAVRPDLSSAVDVTCPYGCQDEQTKRARTFAGVTQEVAQGSCDQHIIAVHKDAVASRAVGDTIAKAMKGNQGQTIDAAMIAQIVAATIAGLRGVELGAVAAVATETAIIETETVETEWVMPDPQADPAFEPVELKEGEFVPSRQDIDSMTRAEMMKFAAANKDRIKPPEAPFKMTSAQWRRYLYLYLGYDPELAPK